MNARRFKVVDVDERHDGADLVAHEGDRSDDLDLDGADDLARDDDRARDDVDTDGETDFDLDLETDLGESDDLPSEPHDEVATDPDADGEPTSHDAANDRVEVAAPRPIPASHPRISEAVRYLLDRYAMTAATEFPPAIAVVSALRKEGVTTVSQSLAEVLSVDFGYSVCWVDVSWAEGAPVRQRGILRRLRGRRRSQGPSPQPGILNVVGGDAALEDVLRTSDETKVAHLAAGRTTASLREITRGVELHDLIDELQSKFEIVVFDSAPVSENSAALSLIQLAEAYVFVTQHGATTSQQVTEAVRLLDPLPAMGAVLNSYRSRTPRFIRRFFPAER